MKTNAKIRMAGISKPIIEYSSGLLELRHARHHMIENMIEIIMMNVPAPIPKTLVEDVVAPSTV